MFGLPHIMQIGGGQVTKELEKKWVRRHRFLFPVETFIPLDRTKRTVKSLRDFGLVENRDYVYIPSEMNKNNARFLFRDRDKVLEWKLSSME